MKLSGIYCIEDAKGRLYYGSSQDIRERKRQHFNRLVRGVHDNPKIQCVFNVHGQDYFSFYIVEVVTDLSVLLEREQSWIDFAFNSLDAEYRFNSNRYVDAPNRGRKASEETRKKISIAVKNRPTASLETREKLSKAGKGRIVSDETKKKISEKNKGKVDPPEVRAKMAATKTGVKRGPMGDVTKQRLGDANAIKTNRVYTVLSPDGTIYTDIVNMSRFCREHNIHVTAMLKWGHTKGFKIVAIQALDEYKKAS